jgi:Beta/Gamma crystallin
MKTILRHALAAALAGTALAAAGVQAAEMTIYGQPGFHGKSFTLRGNANLADINFENRVSSLVVHSGTWEVCTEPDLRGRCVTLGPGEYASLDRRLDDRIESMRTLERHAGRDRDRNEGVVIYTQPNFSGKSVALKGAANDLTPHGIQDQASSIVVHSGQWEFCSQPDFRGDCVTLARGEYPTLEQRLLHRVESVREVERVADRRERRWEERRWDERNDRDYYGRR